MLHPDLFALARNLLELAADAFARNSSNDYTLPDLDPEAREQLAALVTAGRGSDEEPDTAEAFGPEAIVSDWQIMLALARGLSREGGEIQQFIWDTGAAKETAVQQERAAVVEVVIEYATACGLSLEGLISGLTPAALVQQALHHADRRVEGRDAYTASVIDTMAATLDATSAALAEREDAVIKLAGVPGYAGALEYVRGVVNTTRRAFEQASGGKTPTVADLVAAIHRGAR